MKRDLYQETTDRILTMMQEHGSNWINPMKRGALTMPTNIASGKQYRGINILILAWAGYGSSTWGTYKQWADKGAQVRKGEKAQTVVFWQFLEKQDEAGNDIKIPMLRQYSVFNAEQVDGYEAPAITETPLIERIEAAELFFKTIPAIVTHNSSGNAFYLPSSDSVSLPPPEGFIDTETSTAIELYYSTLGHELVHWTGHASRLDRIKASSFGSDDYAREELVAEIGAAILCAHLGLSSEPRADHAKYLNCWMQQLSDKPREFIKAAGAAQKAVDLLIGYSEPAELDMAA